MAVETIEPYKESSYVTLENKRKHHSLQRRGQRQGNNKRQTLSPENQIEDNRQKKGIKEKEEEEEEEEEEDDDIEEEESPEQIAKQYKKFSNAPKFNYNSEELFCICRRVDDGEIMVACDGCEEWFHFKCMKIDPKLSNLIAKFYCKFCKWKGDGRTLWKRKCRLQGCYLPIKNDSKYCSSEHGEEYMTRLLLHGKGLNRTIIKRVIDFVEGDGHKLRQLGKVFPEVDIVTRYKSNPNSVTLSPFPETTKIELAKVDEKIKCLDSDIQQYELRSQSLVKCKELIKTLNEKVTKTMFPEENFESLVKPNSKKSKQKKRIDLCLCDRSEDGQLIQLLVESENVFNELIAKLQRRDEEAKRDTLSDEEEDGVEKTQQEAEEGFENRIKEDFDLFRDNLCIKEKKKCHRHNGWWGLYYDETDKLLDQLYTRKSLLEQEKDAILRNYSILVYES